MDCKLFYSTLYAYVWTKLWSSIHTIDAAVLEIITMTFLTVFHVGLLYSNIATL